MSRAEKLHKFKSRSRRRTRPRDLREQSKANLLSEYAHGTFVMRLGVPKLFSYTDGGAAMLTNREHDKRRAVGRAARRARKVNR
jgi:hypothetical protein